MTIYMYCITQTQFIYPYRSDKIRIPQTIRLLNEITAFSILLVSIPETIPWVYYSITLAL